MSEDLLLKKTSDLCLFFPGCEELPKFPLVDPCAPFRSVTGLGVRNLHDSEACSYTSSVHGLMIGFRILEVRVVVSGASSAMGTYAMLNQELCDCAKDEVNAIFCDLMVVGHDRCSLTAGVFASTAPMGHEHLSGVMDGLQHPRSARPHYHPPTLQLPSGL